MEARWRIPAIVVTRVQVPKIRVRTASVVQCVVGIAKERCRCLIGDPKLEFWAIRMSVLESRTYTMPGYQGFQCDYCQAAQPWSKKIQGTACAQTFSYSPRCNAFRLHRGITLSGTLGRRSMQNRGPARRSQQPPLSDRVRTQLIHATIHSLSTFCS